MYKLLYDVKILRHEICLCHAVGAITNFPWSGIYGATYSDNVDVTNKKCEGDPKSTGTFTGALGEINTCFPPDQVDYSK